MEKREIWVEGSFAGEFKVEDRLADASGDDALAGAFDEDDWSEGDEEGWFDEDDFDEGDDRDIPFFDPGEENDARHCDSCIFRARGLERGRGAAEKQREAARPPLEEQGDRP